MHLCYCHNPDHYGAWRGARALTKELIIIEASGSELEILGTARIFLQTDVLGPARKFMDVAVIAGTNANKEIPL